MSDERVDWLHEMFALWNSGVRELREPDKVHPEFELHTKMLGGVVRGADGLQHWFDEIDQQFDAWQIEIADEHDLGEGRFLLVGSVRLRGRESGLEMDQELAWRAEFEGERIRLLKTYTDPEQALKEARLV